MIYVALGGGIGAIFRYLLSQWISSRTNSSFPLATWMINISGSYALGFLANLYLSESLSERLWLLLGVGCLGAFTTFSTFGYETIRLLEQKHIKKAAVYVSTSALLGLLFAYLGSLTSQLIG